MGGLPLALRTWIRYVVPLTLLSAIALAPLCYVAWKLGAPVDVPRARNQIRLAYALAGMAIAFQLLLVAGVAPAVRAVASGSPLPQWRALGAGLASLVRAVVPWLVAILAVVLGGLALIVPGALLLVLVSLTGASDALREPVPAPIVDSIAVVRAQLPRIALVVAGIVVVDLAITYAMHLVYVPAPLAKKMAAAKLAPIRTFVRATVGAIIVIAPLAACVLAARYSSAASHAKRS